MEILRTSDPAESWRRIWQWRWFARETWQQSWRGEVSQWCDAVEEVLRLYKPARVMDASCGLGFKTVLLAEKGFAIAGSDPDAFAISCAKELSRLPYYCASYEELPDVAPGPWSCVHSDHFDFLVSIEEMVRAAKALHRVIEPGGVFVFGAVNNETAEDLQRAVDEDWRKTEPLVVMPPVSRDGVTMTEVHLSERTAEGIRRTQMYLVDDHGRVRVESAELMFLARWTRKDFARVFHEAGFKELRRHEVRGLVFYAAIR